MIEDAGVSAKTLDRPGLNRALAMLDQGEAAALLGTSEIAVGYGYASGQPAIAQQRKTTAP